MKRSAFIASLLGLFGVAKAQNLTIPPSLPIFKYINNQCPVCRHPAPSYKRPLEHKHDGYRGVGDYLVTEVNPRNEPYGPKRILVDGGCRNCNAAFWQDAEE